MPSVKLPRPEWYENAPAEGDTPVGFRPQPKADDDVLADDVGRDAWLDDAVVVEPMTPPPK